MIKVIQKKNRIIITGHASYKKYGEDIVCASVSSIVYTSINGILNINNKAIRYTDDNTGIKIEVLSNDNITNKLISNMLDLICELEKDYPDKISISKGE